LLGTIWILDIDYSVFNILSFLNIQNSIHFLDKKNFTLANPFFRKID